MRCLLPNQVLSLIELLSTNETLRPLLFDVPVEGVDKSPWESNYAAVARHEDLDFCKAVAEAMGEPRKVPKSVALMRSLNDPDQTIDGFHSIHIDSRFSEKSLVVLKGSSDYLIFSDTQWSDFSLLERVELLGLQVLNQLIEKLKFRALQFKYTHNLSSRLRSKVYKNHVYSAIPGSIIKFNNMLPHHSHMRPTKFSVLLQVVYT